MANNITATKQQQFAANMLTLLKEGKGGKLVQFCESDRNVEGESYTFYRVASSTTTNDLDLYKEGYVGTAGDAAKVTVNPKFVYAHGFKTEAELAVTKLDIKSAYLKSFKAAVDRAEDAEIIAAIAAEDTSLTKKGVATTALTEQFNELVKAIAYAQALVGDNDDHGAKVAVVMNKKDYAELFAVDKFASSEFFKITDVGTMLAGGLLVPTDAVTSGTVYILPQNAVCFASWKGGEKTNMTYNDGKDGYFIWARKSIGAKVAEADSIIKFQAKAIA